MDYHVLVAMNIKKNWNDIFKTKKETKKTSEPKTRLEQMAQLNHDPIID